MENSKTKIISLLLVLVLISTTLVACSKKGSSTEEASNNQETKTEVSENTEKEKESQEGTVFDIAGNQFELVASDLMEDCDGDINIVNTWKFTNNTQDATSPALNVYMLLTQKGEELDTPGSIFIKEGSTDQLSDYGFENVEPGESGMFFTSYKLKDKESPVKIQISDIDGTDAIEVELNIAEMETVTVDSLQLPE
ncbi:DUF5067 domain-containing protein [Peptoniphilus catoniae]|uniref:DUF5067 domain-containing protein n=1 Tax=Peptoniphilus catoniae TaxID=1660341 RepID=UPI0010FD8467|nr:DUF5067 domain-containing protein [Peptoniphilus catoniae]